MVGSATERVAVVSAPSVAEESAAAIQVYVQR